jgi:phosphocarrier protein
MENLMNILKKTFGLKASPEIYEVDIGGVCPLSEYVKKEFHPYINKSDYNINAHIKIKKTSNGNYLFEGAIAHHEEKKERIVYLRQMVYGAHIHGDFISKLDSEDEISSDFHAQTSAELASKIEKLFLTDHPVHSENGYTHTSVELTNKSGMHARPAAAFVEVCNKYQSDIYVRNGKDSPLADIEIKGKKYIDGKSIMSLLTLAAEKGNQLEIIAQGEDSKQAIDSLVTLIKCKFHED